MDFFQEKTKGPDGAAIDQQNYRMREKRRLDAPKSEVSVFRIHLLRVCDVY